MALKLITLSQLQFDLIQAQAMAHLQVFAMVLGCLLKVTMRHFQPNIVIYEYVVHEYFS